MLNTRVNFKINTCSGGIYKTYLESWFERFHLKSDRSEQLLCKERYGAQRDKVVLQMVICGDMEVMAELVYTKDYVMQFINQV